MALAVECDQPFRSRQAVRVRGSMKKSEQELAEAGDGK